MSGNKIQISSDAAGNVAATLDQSYEATLTYTNSALQLLSAEVINLSRNVLVTGDDFKEVNCNPTLSLGDETLGCVCDSRANIQRTKCHLGLHTALMGQGKMQIQYARVEKCGQRGVQGKCESESALIRGAGLGDRHKLTSHHGNESRLSAHAPDELERCQRDLSW